MKIIYILILFLCATQASNAQTWNEWFAQKKTQREYLLQQIAALQVHTGYVKDGYSIVENGVHTIRDIKNSDFDMHNRFFNALTTINPAILQYSKIADIIRLAYLTQSTSTNTVSNINSDVNLTSDEKNYLHHVFASLLKNTNDFINKLTLVTTNHLLEMTDDERITQIDISYEEIKGIYVFVQDFSKTVQVLIAQRTHSQYEISKSKSLNGLP